MRGPEKESIVCSLILLYKRLFLELEYVTSRSQSSNFTVAPKLPFQKRILN